MANQLEFLTHDHPTANGRQPEKGDVEYVMRFPLEDGTELLVRMGQQGFDLVTQMLFDMLTGAPSYDDRGS